MNTTSEVKRLTIYMLESMDRRPDDHLLPLVEKIHPSEANKITWMLVQDENNFEIINMIGDPEHPCARVDEMDALLKARETGNVESDFQQQQQQAEKK